MIITTKGIIIREQTLGENDKIIDVLTEDLGVISVCVKGSKKINSKNVSLTQIFSYAKFCVSSKKTELYYLNSAEPIKIFYDIRLDITNFALASYFCEIIRYTVTTQQDCINILRLFLNSLHFLSTGLRDPQLIKCIFELRLTSYLGYMPNLVGCNVCNIYNSDSMYLDLENGFILCSKCLDEQNLNKNDFILINKSILHTLRHIVYSDISKLFNFKISTQIQKTTSFITENYLINCLGRSFKTLEFYKSL